MPADADPRPAARALLLSALATFLFVGGLRGFLSSVYYQNLAALELNATALYALLLLSPALWLVPALAARPRAMLLAGAAALAIGRIAQPLTRGSALHLPLSGLAVAGFLVLLVALVRARAPRAATLVAIGLAAGWALDVALTWLGESADPTAAPRGLLLVAPAAAALVVLALGTAVEGAAGARGGWLAGAGLGAWIFVQNVMLGNAFAAARWDGGAPAAYAVAILVGLAVGGALLATVRARRRGHVLALNAALLFAVLDHALVHSPLAPLLVAAAQVALVADAALLARALAAGHPGALLAGGAGALVLHFVFAFTFLFHYVPLGGLWKGQEETVFALAALLAVAPALLAQRAPAAPPARLPRRPVVVAFAAPLLVAVVAAATPGAPVPEPDEGAPLRLMTFNLHQGFANDGVLDPSVFVRVLEEERPDVVVVQEGDTPRFTSGNLDVLGHLAAQSGYHVVYGQPTREQAFGGALLTRVPVREWRAIQLPSDADNRFYTEARLEVHGRDVWLYAVHLALPHEDRMQQTRAILERAATREGPVVLAGDFNSCDGGLCADYEEGVSDDVVALVTARYADAWTAAGNEPHAAEGVTYPETGVRIDYVFVSEGVEVVAARVVRTPAALAASDHLPVVAELRFG